MTFRESLKTFTKTPWFRLIYLVLLGLASGSMFFAFAFSQAGCLAIFVIALTAFVVPFWFGERRSRRHVVNGVIVFLVALLVLTVLRTDFVLNLPPVEIQSDPAFGADPSMTLRMGNVTPYHAAGPTNFTFRVLLNTTDNATPAEFNVWLNLTTFTGFVPTEASFPMGPDPSNLTTNAKNGTWYVTNATLYGAVYGFGFAVRRLASGNWTSTFVFLGPIAAPYETWLAYSALGSSSTILITFVFFVFILFLWWYSGRMRRTRAGMADRAHELRKESPRAESGKAGKSAAFTCTNCGADVTGDASSCPKCGAVFEE